MRKLLYFITALLALAGCKKTEELNFEDRPEIRMYKSIEEVNAILTGATNGWVGTLTTQDGGGYGFYMNFGKDEKVSMIGDLTNESSSKAATSTYRVKAGNGAELIFDTYNYISLLGDPNPAVFGGARGTGLKSDVEFQYDYSAGDSIIFIGKKYRQSLVMLKATAAQKAFYENGSYKAAIDQLKAFFVTNKFPYVDFPIGSVVTRVGIGMNSSNDMLSGKRVDFTGALADGKTVLSLKNKFAFKPDGAEILGGGIKYSGTTFVKFAWKDANTLVLFDSAGKEYPVKNAPGPVVDINLLWGVRFNTLRSEFKTIYPGTTTKGADILNYYHNNLNNSALIGFSFNYGRINLDWNTVNKRLIFNGRCTQSGPSETGGWVTSITYNYTVGADGSYTFTKQSPATGGYVANIMTRLDQFLLSNRVKFDSYIDGSNFYARMTSVDDPTIVMTFLAQ